MSEPNLYDPEHNRMSSKDCWCCHRDSIRAFRSADGLCKRCSDEPETPFFLPSGRGLVEHSCRDARAAGRRA